MSDDSDSWLQNAFGLNVAQVAQNVEAAVAPAVQAVTEAAAPAVQAVEEAAAPAFAAVQAGAQQAAAGAEAGMQAYGSFVQDVRDESPYVDGVLTAGVAGVQDVAAAGADMMAPPAEGATVEDAAVAGFKRPLEMAASVYTAATGVWDAATPNVSALNKDLGDAVDTGENMVDQGYAYLNQEVGDVPVVGQAAAGAAVLGHGAAQILGGFVKGAGDVTTGVSNLIMHPIDTTSGLVEMSANVSEHLPVVGAISKGEHGIYDLVRGKTDGKYGANLQEVCENVVNNTERDPTDPTKRINRDGDALLDVAAGLGGGRKAWEDKPVEAAIRTVTNLAPMIFGEGAVEGTGEIPAAAGEFPSAARAPRAGVPEPVPGVEPGGLPAPEAGPAMPEAGGRTFAEADTQIPETQGNEFVDADTEAPQTQGRRVARTVDMNIPEAEGGDFAGADTEAGPGPSAREFADADTQIPETQGNEFVDADTEAPQTQGRRVARTVDMKIPELEGGDFAKAEPQYSETPGGGDLAEAPTETPPPQGKRVADTVDGSPPVNLERIIGKPRKRAPSDDSLTAENAKQNYSEAAELHKAAEAAEIKAIQDASAYRWFRPRDGFKGDPTKWDPSVDKALSDSIAEKSAATQAALDRLEASQDALRPFFKEAGIKVPDTWD